MDDKRPSPKATLEELSRRLALVERRLATLEDRIGAATDALEPTRSPQAKDESGRTSAGEILPLLGRTLLMLAGAFLLRAVTEMGLLPQMIGTALGVGYAILLILLADRAARKGRRTSGTFHGLAAAFIAYPLLWEATVKFEFLSPVACAIGLTAVTTLALVLAWRHRLRRSAWVFTLACSFAALALGVGTRMPLLFTGVLLLLGVASLWLGYVRGWTGLSWTVAALVDSSFLLLAVIFVTGRTEQVQQVFHPTPVLWLQLSLVVLYLGSFAARILTAKRPVDVGEIVQGCVVMALGLGGAATVVGRAELSGVELGLTSLLLAAGSYGVSFVFIERRSGSRSNFVFFTTLALLFALVSLGALLEGAGLAIAYAAAALFSGWVGGLKKRATLSLHGAAYVAAAAITVGLVRSSARALAGPVVEPADWNAAPVLTVLSVAAVSCLFDVPVHGKTWGALSRVSKLTVLAISAIGIGGVVVSYGATLLPRASGAGVDRAVLAVLRSGVLAVAAVALAWLGRWRRLYEATWLVFPVLILGGLKLVFEDIRLGRPATLVGSLIFYGGALILASHLARRKKEHDG